MTLRNRRFALFCQCLPPHAGDPGSHPGIRGARVNLRDGRSTRNRDREMVQRKIRIGLEHT